jgi:hypothetical protein
MEFPFKGNWLVNYKASEFNYPDILIELARLSDRLRSENINFRKINVNFNKNANKSTFFREITDIFIEFNGSEMDLAEGKSGSFTPAAFKPLEKAIKTVSLLFPRLESDPRWKSIGLPAGQLFLASGLCAAGFQASPLPLLLPAENPPPEALEGDLAGITLFEDLLPLLRPILADFRLVYPGILAAGGPFPTLSPLAAVFHLPQVNLFVRGEAEMALPRLLEALNRGDAGSLFSQEGVFWQQPGLIAMAGFDRINRPESFDSLAWNLDFLRQEHAEQGLEMNFSRGCVRGCLFCCHAQGTKLGKLPLEKAGELLEGYQGKLRELAPVSGAPRAVNINDDDILQDPAYAENVFNLLKKNEFRIFGIQTSPAALIRSDGSPRMDVLDLAADPGLYVDSRPLLWLGSDAFLPARARRLGKRFPGAIKFSNLLGGLEKRNLLHFHYWISSDGDSTWKEFVEELSLIFGFFRDFPGFGLLAHSPFIVPYPASRLFERLGPGDSRLKLKLGLDAPDPRLRYAVVERLETKWPSLNKLLMNEKAGGEEGFFDFLKEKNFIAAAQLAYHFLKQEQLQGSTNDPNLLRAREKLERLIARLM